MVVDSETYHSLCPVAVSSSAELVTAPSFPVILPPSSLITLLVPVPFQCYRSRIKKQMVLIPVTISLACDSIPGRVSVISQGASQIPIPGSIMGPILDPPAPPYSSSNESELVSSKF